MCAYLLRLIVEQPDQSFYCFELLEAQHVFLADGALPDGASSGGEQLLVVALVEELRERVQPSVLPHKVPRLLLLRALKHKPGGEGLNNFKRLIAQTRNVKIPHVPFQISASEHSDCNFAV